MSFVDDKQQNLLAKIVIDTSTVTIKTDRNFPMSLVEISWKQPVSIETFIYVGAVYF